MYSETSRRNILTLAEAYEEATGRPPTMISMSFYGNGTFFRDYEKRVRSISVERLGKMFFDFAKSWPPDVRFPEEKLMPIYFTQQNLLQQHYVRRWRESDNKSHAKK